MKKGFRAIAASLNISAWVLTGALLLLASTLGPAHAQNRFALARYNPVHGSLDDTFDFDGRDLLHKPSRNAAAEA
jgi:hypothetical protein